MIRSVRKAVLIATVVLWSGLAIAGDAGRETPFSIGAGGRSIGFGGAYTSLATDAYATYYNPAHLAALEYQQVAFSHSVLFEESVYDLGAWVVPINEKHGVGVAFMRIGTDDIIRRENFAARGQFDFSYSQALIGYGHELTENLSLGMNLKIVNQSLDTESDFGVGLDVGLSARLFERLAFGLTVRDALSPRLKLITVNERTPLSVAAGLSLAELAVSDYVSLTTAVDLEKTEDRSVKVHAGAEMNIHQAFMARIGYDRDNLTFGTGIRYGRFGFDYAYKLTDYVADVHHLSISFNLGRSVTEMIRQREQSLIQPEPQLSPEEIRFNLLMESADRYFKRFQLDSAQTYYEQALSMQPGNQEILGTLAAIENARRVEEARQQQLQTALDEQTQTLNSFMSQAESLFENKTYRAALDLLKLIFDIQPRNARALQLQSRINDAMQTEITDKFTEARTAINENRLVDAIGAYNRILEIDPNNAGAKQSKRQVLDQMDLEERLNLAIGLFDQGRLNEARGQLQAVLLINPKEPRALEYLGKINEAEKKVSTLEDLQKDEVHWGLYLDGLRHMRNKEYQKAIEAWEKVLVEYPNNPNTLDNIKQARLRLGTANDNNSKE